MIRHSIVKPEEVFSVDGRDGAIRGYGIGKDYLVRNTLVGVAGVQGGRYIVSGSRSFTTGNSGKFSFE
jgi:hypothetical protein